MTFGRVPDFWDELAKMFFLLKVGFSYSFRVAYYKNVSHFLRKRLKSRNDLKKVKMVEYHVFKCYFVVDISLVAEVPFVIDITRSDIYITAIFEGL